MSRFYFIIVFIVGIIINTVYSYPYPQAQQAQNVGLFLSELLKSYVPKDVSPYTIINGQPPNLSSPIGRIGAGSFPQGQFIMFPPPPKPAVSQERWSPVGFPQFNHYPQPLGRSGDFAFALPLQLEELKIDDSQNIITADQGSLQKSTSSDKISPQPRESAEFQIQSQMAF